MQSFEALSDAELEAKLGTAEHAFAQHKRTTYAEHAQGLMRVAEILDRERRDFGHSKPA